MTTYPAVLFIRLFFRWATAATLVLGCAAVGFILGALNQLQRMMPSSEELASYRPQLTTEIYSTEVHADGSETHTLLARVFKEDRESVDLAEVPQALIDATIAIEDRRFWEHHGVSLRDMARAAYVDIMHRDWVQGASTITQQLVRNAWLSHERTWDRKLKEAMLALEVERKYSKEEILEMYLNQVCYGHGMFGIKTAARLYYGKEPKDLKLHECAMLAGLPQWPVGYSPYRHPDRCRARRDTVLAWMEREGKITASQRRAAERIPITQGLQPLKERGVAARHAPYFTNLVLRKLCEEYGDDAIYGGGLRVYTTLDLRVQQVAEEELTEGVESLRRQGELRKGLIGQGALVCVEVKTGRVLALVGGVGPYEKVQFNRAQPYPPYYGRQPGSSFKPYIWACALENGYGPESVFSGDPISIRIGPGEYWTPHNYSRRQGGNYTLRRALAQSVNLVSVRLVKKLTIPTVRSLAAKMLNIPVERLRPFWALALGTSELSPLEQAVGYCAFANQGLRPTCRLVRRIEDQEGHVLVNFDPELVPVIRPETANSMLSMLRTAVQSGTGKRASACGFPCGGKTGTTNSGRDVWFVGVTPDLSVAVWVGNDNNAPMPGGSGGGFCAPIWADFVRRAGGILGCRGQFPRGAEAKSERADEPERDEGGRIITVCAETDLRATEECPVTKEIRLERGEKPPGFCTVHRGSGNHAGDTDRGAGGMLRVCAVSGELATPWCPAARMRRFAPGEAPSGHCTLHGPPDRGGDDETTAGPADAGHVSGAEKDAKPSGSESGKGEGDTPVQKASPTEAPAGAEAKGSGP